MLAPLSPLPRGAFVAALLLLNSAAWTTCIVASVYLATGRVRGNHPALYFWPSLAVIPFVHDTYLLGQPALLLAGPAARGLRAACGGARPVAAGGADRGRGGDQGVSDPRGRLSDLSTPVAGPASRWCVTLAALMFVAPLAFRSPQQVGEDFAFWVRGMLLKYDENSIAQRPDRAYSFKNQSVQATVHRLARPVLADGEADRRWTVNLLEPRLPPDDPPHARRDRRRSASSTSGRPGGRAPSRPRPTPSSSRW